MSGAAVATAHVGRFNPFPGLRPYEPDEDYLFFGRGQQTDELLRKLRTTRFLAVLGTSGSGKSSLVRSGLIPSLRGGGMPSAGSQWRIAIVDHPAKDPIGNLCTALRDALTDGEPAADANASADFVRTTLHASKLGLVECIRQARLGENVNVLVLIDQFEEIFRYRKEVSRDQATAFVKLLVAARQSDVPCYVAVTMRSDFIVDCMEFAEMPGIINDGLYLVPRMTRDELRSAITGPIAVGGASVSPRLVSRLLNDVGDDPDQLPVLQHALMRTWDRWEERHEPGEPLDLEHYTSAGTMRAALSNHAQAAFDGLDARQRVIAEKMFKALTDVVTDPRGIRRTASVCEVMDLTAASEKEVTDVVEVFREAGRSFLLPPHEVPLDESSVLDISHESLMRTWSTLAHWAREEAESARMYMGIAKAAALHKAKKEAYWRDPELQFALDWRERTNPTPEWARRYDQSFADAMAFLDGSREERDREVREYKRRRRFLFVVLIVTSVIVAAFGLYALEQERKAEKQAQLLVEINTDLRRAISAADRAKHDARTKEAAARLAQSQAVAAKKAQEEEAANAVAHAEIATRQKAIADSALVKQSEALVNARQSADDAANSEAKARAATTVAQEQSATAHERLVETNRLTLLAASRALALKLRQQPGTDPVTQKLALYAYRLHTSHRGGPESVPDLYGAMRAALPAVKPLMESPTAVRAVATSPDGQTAFAVTNDGKLFRAPLRGGEKTFVGEVKGLVRSMALDSTGDRVAVGTTEGRVWIWNLRRLGSSPAEHRVDGFALGDDVPAVAATAVAFHPATDGIVAAGTSDGNVLIWPRGQLWPTALLFPGAPRQVRALAFSPNGQYLIAGLGAPRSKGDADDVGALIWKVEDLYPGRPMSRIGPWAEPMAACHGMEGVEVRSVAFANDNNRFACGGRTGKIMLASLSGDRIGPVMSAHSSPVNSVSFAPKGDLLASASADKTLRIWDVQTPAFRAQMTLWNLALNENGWMWSAAFTRDGDYVVTGSENGVVRKWPARTSVLARELCASVDDEPLDDAQIRQSIGVELPEPDRRPCAGQEGSQ